MATHTPWGQSQHSERIAVGIMSYQTAGHGGVHLTERLNALVPDYMRNDNKWYEEDCEWAIVACVFPEEYIKHYADRNSDFDIIEIAKDTLKAYYPDQYERFYNVKLSSGESFSRATDVFMEENKDNYLVISAVNIDPYNVECIACIGADRNNPAKTFYVSQEEYSTRNVYFVIDTDRHSQTK